MASLDGAARETLSPTLVGRLQEEIFQGREDDRNAIPTRPQAFFQQKVDATLWRQLRQNERRRRHQDRLEAVGRPYAGAVWACFPTGALGLKLTTKEFVTAAQVWLGVADGPGGDGAKALLEQGTDQISRHDAVRDVLYETSTYRGLRPHRSGSYWRRTCP